MLHPKSHSPLFFLPSKWLFTTPGSPSFIQGNMWQLRPRTLRGQFPIERCGSNRLKRWYSFFPYFVLCINILITYSLKIVCTVPEVNCAVLLILNDPCFSRIYLVVILHVRHLWWIRTLRLTIKTCPNVIRLKICKLYFVRRESRWLTTQLIMRQRNQSLAPSTQRWSTFDMFSILYRM